MFFPLPGAPLCPRRTIHINILSSPRESHQPRVEKNQDSHQFSKQEGCSSHITRVRYGCRCLHSSFSFCSAYSENPVIPHASAAIYLYHENLQGLNIWNMLIQFYTKFGRIYWNWLVSETRNDTEMRLLKFHIKSIERKWSNLILVSKNLRGSVWKQDGN